MNTNEYKYYLQKTYSENMNMNNILDTLCHKYELEYYLLKKLSTHRFKYSKIFKYLKIIYSQNTATYQSEDCG